MFRFASRALQANVARRPDLRIRSWEECVEVANSNGEDKLFAGLHTRDGTLDTKAFFARGYKHIAIASVIGIFCGVLYKVNDNIEVAKQRAEYPKFVAVAAAAEKARREAKAAAADADE